MKCRKTGCSGKPVFEGKACEKHMCPDCEGRGYNEPVFEVKVSCPECGGTGVDGGTQLHGWSKGEKDDEEEE